MGKAVNFMFCVFYHNKTELGVVFCVRLFCFFHFSVGEEKSETVGGPPLRPSQKQRLPVTGPHPPRWRLVLLGGGVVRGTTSSDVHPSRGLGKLLDLQRRDPLTVVLSLSTCVVYCTIYFY